MIFETAIYSNSGGKNVNKDSYIVDNNMWILADGLDECNSGNISSQICVQKVQQVLRNGNADLIDAINEANKSVIENQQIDSRYRTMKTTVVAATVHEDKLEYANVGDSRFYYLKNGKISYISEDHSLSAVSAKIGEIAFEDIRNDSSRKKLLQIIGDNGSTPLNIPCNTIYPEKGDAFLLCSDGFWEYVYEQEMEIDFLKSQSAQQWLEFMVKRILLKTFRKEKDNFTVITVMIK